MKRSGCQLIYLIILLVLFSCQNNSEKYSEKEDSTGAIKSKKREKYFAGKPDIPRAENEITSAGIGPVLLNDSLERLELLYKDKKHLIQNILINEEGKVWPAKKLTTGDGYIIAEAVNTIDLISVLRTNHPAIKASNGVYAGIFIDSLPNIEDSLKVNYTHKTLTYGTTGVWFKIDSKAERQFFRKSGTIIPKGARVEELIITCSDC